jgi:hypothetical protein
MLVRSSQPIPEVPPTDRYCVPDRWRLAVLKGYYLLAQAGLAMSCAPPPLWI